MEEQKRLSAYWQSMYDSPMWADAKAEEKRVIESIKDKEWLGVEGCYRTLPKPVSE